MCGFSLVFIAGSYLETLLISVHVDLAMGEKTRTHCFSEGFQLLPDVGE